MFGLGRQQSSEQKIAAAEQEMEMVSDMFNKYAFPKHLETHAIQKLFQTLVLGNPNPCFSVQPRDRESPVDIFPLLCLAPGESL